MERVISRAHSLVQKLVPPLDSSSDRVARECLLDLSRDLLHSRGPLRLAFSTTDDDADADAAVEIRRPSRRTRETEQRERTQREALLKLVTDSVRSGGSLVDSDFAKPNASLSDSQALLAFFGKPVEREYVLRATAPPREPAALPAPQRLHALILSESVHISGAFSHETLAI